MKPRGLDVLLYVLVGMVIVGGAFGMMDAAVKPDLGKHGIGETVTTIGINPFKDATRLSLLLLGSDDRITPDGHLDRGRSDSSMVIFINEKLHRGVMLTLPRDLLVHIPEAPKGVQAYPQKLNAAYAFGGPTCTQKTILREFGVQTDYYAKIAQEDFIKVVDMLGGVDLVVPDYEGKGRGMNYDDSWGELHVHLKPGLQHLNGNQAQGFVRYRKSEFHTAKGGAIGITDMERGGNAQVFLKAMIEQKVHPSNTLNLMRAANFIMSHLDTNLDWPHLFGLAMVARGLDTNHVLHLVVPVDDKKINGIDYVEARAGAFEELNQRIDAYLSGASEETTTGNMPYLKKEIGSPAATPGAPASATPAAAATATPAPPQGPFRVRVLNGSGTPGAAKLAANKLTAKNVRLDPIGNADRYDYKETIIEYLPGQEGAAQEVATALGLPGTQVQQVTADPSTKGLAVTVVVGQDFLNVAKPATGKSKGGGHKQH